MPKNTRIDVAGSSIYQNITLFELTMLKSVWFNEKGYIQKETMDLDIQV